MDTDGNSLCADGLGVQASLHKRTDVKHIAVSEAYPVEAVSITKLSRRNNSFHNMIHVFPNTMW